MVTVIVVALMDMVVDQTRMEMACPCDCTSMIFSTFVGQHIYRAFNSDLNT